jgi:uncharacterized protein YecE (DUF72 family)
MIGSRVRCSGTACCSRPVSKVTGPIQQQVAARIYLGTAGWAIPRASAERFEQSGTHLERYARTFCATEINSSFYRSHAPSTYAKWASSTPGGFRFAVKVPKSITHDSRLRRARPVLERFLDELAGLGNRCGPLLVQLPPSLAFDARLANTFFALVRSCHEGDVVCEPRHPSWFDERANRLLKGHAISRVAADPPPAAGADTPGGWRGIAYFRLHGSPRRYWSRYPSDYLARLADTIRGLSESTTVWCIFDNTASGAAIENAWELQALLTDHVRTPSSQSPAA